MTELKNYLKKISPNILRENHLRLGCIYLDKYSDNDFYYLIDLGRNYNSAYFLSISDNSPEEIKIIKKFLEIAKNNKVQTYFNRIDNPYCDSSLPSIIFMNKNINTIENTK